MLSATERYMIWKNLVSWQKATDPATQHRNAVAAWQHNPEIKLPRPDDEVDYATLKYPITEDDLYTKEFIERWMAAENGYKYVSTEEFFSVLCEEQNESK